MLNVTNAKGIFDKTTLVEFSPLNIKISKCEINLV